MSTRNAPDLPEGFKTTELGPLPEEWRVVQLKEVADFSRKPRDLVLKNFAKIPFISMDLIPDDGTQMPGYIFKSGNKISSGTYCEPGDILVAKITPCLENGKQCIVPNFKEGFAFATTENIASLTVITCLRFYEAQQFVKNSLRRWRAQQEDSACPSMCWRIWKFLFLLFPNSGRLRMCCGRCSGRRRRRSG